MQEQLIAFPTARLAREKGFNEHCRHGYEWYIYDQKEYGPTELDMPEVSGITSFHPHERHHPGQQDLMKTMKARTMKWPFFKNADLPPYLFARPTQDLLERWLREKHGIYPSVSPGLEMDSFNAVVSRVKEMAVISVQHKTYELAREAALMHALKLLPDAVID